MNYHHKLTHCQIDIFNLFLIEHLQFIICFCHILDFFLPVLGLLQLVITAGCTAREMFLDTEYLLLIFHNLSVFDIKGLYPQGPCTIGRFSLGASVVGKILNMFDKESRPTSRSIGRRLHIHRWFGNRIGRLGDRIGRFYRRFTKSRHVGAGGYTLHPVCTFWLPGACILKPVQPVCVCFSQILK